MSLQKYAFAKAFSTILPVFLKRSVTLEGNLIPINKSIKKMENQNELIDQPSWWKRNWKWAVPVGGCMTIIIVGIIFIAVGAYTFASKIKDASGSDAALIEAQSNQELIAILGEPIESNGFGSFNVSIKDGTKTANSTTPIKGPNGEATINIVTRGEGDDKVYEVYNVTINGSDQVIELSTERID